MTRENKPPKHRVGKRTLAAVLTRREFQVLYEHHFSDVVGYRLRHGQLRIICGEHDLHPRTVLPNVNRNFRNGADGMVILAPDERMRAAFRRKLKRYLPRSIWTRVGIITLATCSAILAREASGSSAAINPAP